jgi:hypothetical protein
MDKGGKYQPRRYKTFINLILSCLFKVTDRYGLSREFSLRQFEMQIMKCEDVYALQETCVRLFSQTISQRVVYEQLLRDCNRLPPSS